jgi:hypothetical protein
MEGLLGLNRLESRWPEFWTNRIGNGSDWTGNQGRFLTSNRNFIEAYLIGQMLVVAAVLHIEGERAGERGRERAR